MRQRIILAALAVATLGCTRTIQRTEALDAVTVPKRWTAAETLSGPPESRWWRHFEDAALDEAIEKSASQNLDLQAAAARVRAALQEVTVAKADLYPSVDLALSNSRQRQNFVGLPLPGGEEEVLSSVSTSAELSFELSWELDLWGRVQAGKLGAIASVDARRADFAGAWLSLTGQIAKAWFAAIEAKRQIELAKAAVASFQNSADRVRARFELGLRSPLDLRLALSEVKLAEAALEERIEQEDRAIRQLEILLGEYPRGGYAISDGLPAMPERIPAGLPSELVHRRPDIVAAERSLYMANASLHQSKADLKPRFSLTATYGTSSDDLRDLLDDDLTIWGFVQNLTMPIFSAGRLRAAVRANEARIVEEAALYESLLLQAYSEVESALAAEEFLARRETALRQATEEAIAAQRLSEERYRLGLIGIITLLSAQRTALNSEVELVQLRRLRLDNRVDLHLALGGGFQSSIKGAPTPKVGDFP